MILTSAMVSFASFLSLALLHRDDDLASGVPWGPVAPAGRASLSAYQPLDVVAAGRFIETIDQSSVIGTTSATAKP